MGEKSTKKETKKKKKSDIAKSTPSAAIHAVVAQPELIKKKKKGFQYLFKFYFEAPIDNTCLVALMQMFLSNAST